MQWPEILFIFSSEALFSEVLCINETHFEAGEKAKKKSLKLTGGKGEAHTHTHTQILPHHPPAQKNKNLQTNKN